MFPRSRCSSTNGSPLPAILDTLKGHKRDKQDVFLDTLFGSEEKAIG